METFRPAARSRQYSLLLLLLVTMVATLAPFVAFSTYSIYSREKDAIAQEKRRLSEYALSLVNTVDRELRSQIELAQTTSTNPALSAGDLQTFWRSAADVSGLVGGHFVLTDGTLQQLANTRLPVGSALPRSRADPSAILRTLESGEPTVGDIGNGAVAREPLFAVRVPVKVNGKPRYVLSYVARSGSMLQVVQQTFRPPGWFAAVIDRNGKLVARSHRHAEFYGTPASENFRERMVSESGLMPATDLEGRESYAAYHKSPLSGWTVLVWAPRTMLEAPAERARQNLYIALALTILASALAALLASKLIRRPTLGLLKSAEQLAAGDKVSYEPSLMSEANVVGEALSRAADIIHDREAALRDREQRLSIVVRELSHRTKNLLAVIQAIANQSVRTSSDLASFQTAFRARISGLARSHDLLVGQNWGQVDLAGLITSQLEPFTTTDSERVRLDGPPVALRPEAAQSLGMALHELATNAVKYGSLSVPAGRLEVTWSVSDADQPTLAFKWRERNGPLCRPPSGSGFGQAVVTKVVPASLNGRAELSRKPDGCEWTLSAPLSALTLSTDQTPREAAA